MRLSHPQTKPTARTHRPLRDNSAIGQMVPGPGAFPAGVRALHARGPQGEMWFRLQRLQGGLYVEREELAPGGLRHLQSMHFGNSGDFERWCDDDPTRFRHPRLYVELKRDAAVLLRPRD